MYSSLHKIDIVARSADGKPFAVQTDHREKAEIEAEREISIVFAIARLVVPRMSNAEYTDTRYVCMSEPPEFLREVVRACGASLAENGEKEPRRPAVPADLEAVSRFAHDALMALGRKVLQRESLDLTPDGLASFEELVKEGGLDREEDETAYHTAMVELGAVAGLLLAEGRDARWQVPKKPMSLVPLVLDVAGTQFNVFGRIERYFEGEVSKGPSALVAAASEVGHETEGKLVGILKSHEWTQSSDVVSEPLLENSAKAGVALPSIAYGYDHPQTIQYMRRNATTMTLVEARERAQAFYRSIQVQVEQLGDKPVWIVTGDYYAPEKLLDTDFAKKLHERLGSPLLMVGFPARGVAAVAPADRDPRAMTATMLSFLELAQRKAEPNDRISAVPFLMQDGAIVGFAQVSDGSEGPPPEPEKKSFWKRLFGGS